MPRSRRWAALGLAIMLLAACGGDDGNGSAVGADADVGDTAAPGEGDGSSDAAQADDTGVILAFRVSGPAGSEIDVAATLDTTSGEVEQPFDQIIDDPAVPRGTGFSGFVDAASLAVTVDQGGPVTVELFTMELDPDADPFVDFATVEMIDLLDQADIALGETVTLAGALP